MREKNMSIPNYYDIATKWQKIAEQGYKRVYKDGEMKTESLSKREVAEAYKCAKHYFQVAKEYGQSEQAKKSQNLIFPGFTGY